MNRPLLRSFLSSSLVLGAGLAQAQPGNGGDAAYYLAPMVAVALPDNSRSDDPAFGGAVAFGRSVAPHLSLELLGNYLRYQGKTVSTPGSGNCGLLTPCPDQLSRTPGQSVLLGGVGANLYLMPDNAGLFLHANVQGGDRFTYQFGLGLDQALFNGAGYLRLEALYQHQAHEDAEPQLQIGLRIPFGGAAPLAELPEPSVAVVPVGQDAAPMASSAEPETTVQPLPEDVAPSAEPAAAPVAQEAAAPAAVAPPPVKKPVSPRRKKAKAVVPAAVPDPAPVQAPAPVAESPQPAPAAPMLPSEPAPSVDLSDEGAAPTEPAPTPPGVKRAQSEPPQAASRPDARARNAAVSDDGSAPTEPAPAPPGAASKAAAAPASSAATMADTTEDGSVATEPAPAPPKP